MTLEVLQLETISCNCFFENTNRILRFEAGYDYHGNAIFLTTKKVYFFFTLCTNRLIRSEDHSIATLKLLEFFNTAHDECFFDGGTTSSTFEMEIRMA